MRFSVKGLPREMSRTSFCPLGWAEQRLGRPLVPPRGLWTSLCVEQCPWPPPWDVRSSPLPPGSSLPLWSFPASGSGSGGGIKEADALSEGCLLPLHLPILGILGDAGGRVQGLLFTRVEAPESQDWSALASGNTERVRACASVGVCVCVFCLSL